MQNGQEQKSSADRKLLFYVLLSLLKLKEATHGKYLPIFLEKYSWTVNILSHLLQIKEVSFEDHQTLKREKMSSSVR